MPQNKLQEINVPPGKRGMLLGTTEVGKSTLVDFLIEDWVTTYNNTLTLIIDTKPHYKPAWFLSGVPTSLVSRYDAMRKGTWLPHGFLLPTGSGTTARSLRQAFSLARTLTPRERGVVLVAQGMVNDHAWLNQVTLAFFELASRNYWLYLYVDEMMVFLHSRANQTGVYQIIVSGAELGIGFLGGAQRPRWIPVEALSEMTMLYLFIMNFAEDMKHLRNMGIPYDFEIPDEFYVFNYWNKMTRKRGLMTLDIGGIAA